VPDARIRVVKIGSYAVKAFGALLMALAAVAVVLLIADVFFGYAPPLEIAVIIESLFWWALILIPLAFLGYGLWKLGDRMRQRSES
jgi:hypothetical protein